MFVFMEYNQRIEVRVTKDMRRKIKEISSKLSIKESEAIRTAINEWIRKQL